jgi:hypothetical protein
MNISEIIQNVATASAVLLGITYLIGGLIVNLNLARRGVTEFEILKTKYLVVGMVFLLHSIGIFTLAALPGFALLLLANNLIALQLINLVSMSGGLVLLRIWAKYPSNTRSRLGGWWFWVFASTAGAVFPMLILLRQLLSPRFDALWIVIIFQAVMTAALTFLAQVYHYSAFYYGRVHGFGSLDPIGVGIPVRVRLACEKTTSALLKGLGIPMKNGVTVNYLYLIDETSHHYIVSMERAASHTGDTFKIEKASIKGIQYHPDHVRAFSKPPASSTTDHDDGEGDDQG